MITQILLLKLQFDHVTIKVQFLITLGYALTQEIAFPATLQEKSVRFNKDVLIEVE